MASLTLHNICIDNSIPLVEEDEAFLDTDYRNQSDLDSDQVPVFNPRTSRVIAEALRDSLLHQF